MRAWRRKQEFGAWTSDNIPRKSVKYEYLLMPYIPTYGDTVTIKISINVGMICLTDNSYIVISPLTFMNVNFLSLTRKYQYEIHMAFC